MKYILIIFSVILIFLLIIYFKVNYENLNAILNKRNLKNYSRLTVKNKKNRRNLKRI